MPKDLQTPFDVAVVMFTKRTGALASAVRSVFAQDFDGRVQVLVATDGPQADRAALADLRREVPEKMVLSIVDLGYSTARSRGGLYAPEAGGALRAALTLLANARHVAYLSEVIVFSPNHLTSLKHAIGDRAWAWTQRLFADARNGSVICRDDWESAGPGGLFLHGRERTHLRRICVGPGSGWTDRRRSRRRHHRRRCGGWDAATSCRHWRCDRRRSGLEPGRRSHRRGAPRCSLWRQSAAAARWRWERGQRQVPTDAGGAEASACDGYSTRTRTLVAAASRAEREEQQRDPPLND